MARYFILPFASDGDKSTVSNETEPSGIVSYRRGYDLPYQYDLKTNPNALPIERDKFNALFNDVTGALQQYQQQGFFPFITPEINNGTAYIYSMGDTVRYDLSDAQDGSEVYNFTSLINGNVTNPKDNPENWRNLTKTDIEFATDEEIANDIEGKAIDPKGLSSVKATADRRGLIQIASDQVFEGGVNTTQAITPAQFYTGFAKLSKLKYMVMYPQGTESAPFTLAGNTRLVLDNPFNDNGSIFCEVQIYFNNMWADPGVWLYTGTGSGSFGTTATYISNTNQIVVQTGASGVGYQKTQFSGGPFGTNNDVSIGSAPFRIRVWSM